MTHQVNDNIINTTLEEESYKFLSKNSQSDNNKNALINNALLQ